jgi:hypothetical protein
MPRPDRRNAIDHVVVIMFENRSFQVPSQTFPNRSFFHAAPPACTSPSLNRSGPAGPRQASGQLTTTIETLKRCSGTQAWRG